MEDWEAAVTQKRERVRRCRRGHSRYWIVVSSVYFSGSLGSHDRTSTGGAAELPCVSLSIGAEAQSRTSPHPNCNRPVRRDRHEPFFDFDGQRGCPSALAREWPTDGSRWESLSNRMPDLLLPTNWRDRVKTRRKWSVHETGVRSCLCLMRKRNRIRYDSPLGTSLVTYRGFSVGILQGCL